MKTDKTASNSSTSHQHYLYLRNPKKNKEKRGEPIALLSYIHMRGEKKVYFGLATFNKDEMTFVPKKVLPDPNKRPDLKEIICDPKRHHEIQEIVYVPRHVTFNRRFLKEIAVGRLFLDRRYAELPEDKADCLKMMDIHTAIMNELLLDKTLPWRVKRSVKLWLKNAEKNNDE
jgi:hypothetical protein